MVENITQLSMLKPGKTYKMEADDVACTITVVEPGPSPICVLYGVFEGYESSADDPIASVPAVVQLVGWYSFGFEEKSMKSLSEQGFINFDKQQGLAWLVGAWRGKEDHQIIRNIACNPTITEL